MSGALYAKASTLLLTERIVFNTVRCYYRLLQVYIVSRLRVFMPYI